MNEWMNNPLLKDIDPIKLELIQRAAAQTSGKSGKDMIPIMMALITGAHKKGIQFTSDEINLILSLLKEGKSPEEQAQIDRTIQMVSTLIRKNHR